MVKDYNKPDWGCLIDFLQSGVEKLLAGIEPTILNIPFSYGKSHLWQSIN